MISATITTVSGASKTMRFQSADNVRTFIQTLPAHLNNGQRVRVTCDILSINTYVTGKAN